MYLEYGDLAGGGNNNMTIVQPTPKLSKPTKPHILLLYHRTMRMGNHLVLIGIPNKAVKGLIYPDVRHLWFGGVSSTNEVHSSSTVLNCIETCCHLMHLELVHQKVGWLVSMTDCPWQSTQK